MLIVVRFVTNTGYAQRQFSGNAKLFLLTADYEVCDFTEHRMKNGVKKQPKRLRICISIEPAVWRHGKILAAQDRRDLSAEIETLIVAEVERRATKEGVA